MRFLAIFVCLLLICGVFAEEEKKTSVVQITADNVDSIKSGNWLVEFFAPWCGHCKRLAPVYEELGAYYNDELKGDKVKIAQVDCVANQGVCQKFEIRGYPTIKYFKDGEAKDYRSQRDKASFIAYIDEMTKNPIIEVESQEQLEKYLRGNKVSFILVKSASDDSAYEQFKKVSNQIQDVGSPNTLVIRDKGVFEEEIKNNQLVLDDKSSTLFVYKDKEYTKFDATQNKQTLNSWVRVNQFPLISELTFSNQQMLTSAFGKIVMFVYKFKPSAEQIQYMKSFASENDVGAAPGDFGYTYIVEGTFVNWISQFGLEKFPAVLVFPEKMDIYYYEDTVNPMDKSSLTKFLSDVHQNKLSLKYLNRLGYIVDQIELFVMDYLYYIIGLSILLPLIFFYFFCRGDEESKNKDE
ncbi:hypothetical protein DICPUDRAFT_93483 [Dictyostelium purpureum]|uniref:Thioredoxin domain-containing protein n=1 Tax=Dictyostelium purpureum TaxID=5786 RepID=F0Z7Y2_DICPU|nr:uncharacterized protein DICPUDRAFT_93483 [Dictyostelium purpureum]EGC39895.1 hypothetical protein DICPUDRAFT_93483 [Dictyostelium purpureum]|eukprot:XP_003283524.1 hypothetical protein DICPUDRAFT_93483 [Dictyostelium purpureum]